MGYGTIIKKFLTILLPLGLLQAGLKRIKFYYGSYTIENPNPLAEDEVITLDIPEFSLDVQQRQLGGFLIRDAIGLDVASEDVDAFGTKVYRVAIADPTGPSVICITYANTYPHNRSGPGIVEYRGLLFVCLNAAHLYLPGKYMLWMRMVKKFLFLK